MDPTKPILGMHSATKIYTTRVRTIPAVQAIVVTIRLKGTRAINKKQKMLPHNDRCHIPNSRYVIHDVVKVSTTVPILQ